VADLSPALQRYRDHCVEAAQKAQDSYDRALLSLSGGGLAISLVFLKDVIGTRTLVSRDLLFWAWLLWVGSILAVLASYFTSQRALTTAVTQVDNGTIHSEAPGKRSAQLTVALNLVSGAAFLAGTIVMLYFVLDNMVFRDAPT
jgi:hypothetical protein